MDLTTSYPRSVRETVEGVVMLSRTSDKARALTAGTIGEYHYNCPMDQTVFEFLGIDHERFLDAVRNAKSDADIAAFVKPFAAAKSSGEIAQFNADFLRRGPAPGSEGEGYFKQLRDQVAPERTDVTSWPDLLDLDEKRDVPRRTAAV